jgi:hypothetical protein
VEFEFQTHLCSFSAASKLLLGLYLSHSLIPHQFCAVSKLLLALYFGHNFDLPFTKTP